MFDFIRTPHDARHEWLKKIRYFKRLDPKLNNNFHIEMRREGHVWKMGLSPRIEEIDALGKYLLNKVSLSHHELESIVLVFLSRSLNRAGEGIFVTANPLILRIRKRLEARHSCKLNIFTVEETLALMDLHAKKSGTYYLFPQGVAQPSLWYLIAFMSRVPNYRKTSRVLGALESRFRYLLMSLDRIGIQYFTCELDSDEEIVYHFNYFISLTTGIFDNLAIETKDRYNITFANGENHPSKISLRNKDFLKELKKYNAELRNHINDYFDFINLIYDIRELVIHREGLEVVTCERKTADDKWKAAMLIISAEIAEITNRIERKKSKDTISKWGIFNNTTTIYLEPYHFAKSATKTLAEFSNTFFALLGLKGPVPYNLQQNVKEFQQWSLAHYH